jgi:murein DD-endopeptidase MepM/ murein hydrolase activator NlpD
MYYYTPEGRGLKRMFMRNPVDFSRISSHFQVSRWHPVLGAKRPHRGVDYAATTGTPIKASGDGTVIFVGKKGGYGKTVIIDHDRGYTTLYAHMSRFKSGLRKGNTVLQGQLIGYVGQTGLATGPHLHYEFRVNGVHKNPVTVKLPGPEPIPRKHMAKFKQHAQFLMAQLDRYQQTRLALHQR